MPKSPNKTLYRRSVFVFGSNLAGRHGKGSAKEALQKHGAIYGMGIGQQGNSYAIPTKGYDLEVLPLDTIRQYVESFLTVAVNSPNTRYNIVAIGCGYAGYSPKDIAPMFANAPPNCKLPEEFVLALASMKDIG